MSKTWDGSGGPRAVIHKRILDVARNDPDASLADIAAEVSGANTDLVERVLSEYGDPGGTDAEEEPDMDDTDTSQNGTQSPAGGQSHTDDSETDGIEHREPLTDPAELTEKQLQTVRAVYEHTDGTQGDIADRLGVTRATVSRRLNDIPGFEWRDRESFTSTLFDDADPDSPVGDSGPETVPADQPGADGRASAETVSDDAADTGASLDADAPAEENSIDRELAHRVVHAAMESERISDEEELDLIAALLD